LIPSRSARSNGLRAGVEVGRCRCRLLRPDRKDEGCASARDIAAPIKKLEKVAPTPPARPGLLARIAGLSSAVARPLALPSRGRLEQAHPLSIQNMR